MNFNFKTPFNCHFDQHSATFDSKFSSKSNFKWDKTIYEFFKEKLQNVGIRYVCRSGLCKDFNDTQKK